MAAVKSVQVRTSGTQDTFSNLNNKWGSDWETPNAPKFPLDINIVGADGESVRSPVHLTPSAVMILGSLQSAPLRSILFSIAASYVHHHEAQKEPCPATVAAGKSLLQYHEE